MSVIDPQNIQWPSETPYEPNDRGTMALGVRDITPAIPEQIIATEDFETDPISGSGTWTLTASSPHSGLRCLRSAVITHNQSTDYTFNIPPGATAIRVWHRVSSENNFDFFRIYKDAIIPGNLLFQLSGTANIWQQGTFDLTGASTVTFRYIKDSSASVGLDAAFIDDIEWIIPGQAAVQEYEPFHLTDGEDRCVKVALCDDAIAITGVVNTRSLDCLTDSVTVCIDDPIGVTGSVAVTGIVDTRPLDCETDSVTVCPPVTGFGVVVENEVNVRPLDCLTDSVTVCIDDPIEVTGVIDTRQLDCLTDSVTVCPGQDPIVVVPGTCFPVNVRLDCEVDSVTVCPPVSGTFEVEPVDYPPAAPLTDDGTPTSFTGAGSIADSTYRSFSLTVLAGPVTVDGITVPAGFSISRSADPGGTVPGFSFDGTGGQIIVDTLREL